MLHSNELLLALDNVLSLAKDAETGQRGYVITGRPEYLVPYRAAVGSIRPQLDALERLIAGDPVQQRLMVDVRRRVGAKLGELELTVALRDRKGFDLTRDVIALGAGHDRDGGAARDARPDGARTRRGQLLAREAAATAPIARRWLGEALAAVAAIARADRPRVPARAPPARARPCRGR